MEDQMATIQDAVREWAYNVGATCPGREWLASNYDTWERNPHFTGTPGRHPEDDGCLLCGYSKTCPMCDTDDGAESFTDPQFQINPATETAKKLLCPNCGIRVYVGVHAGLGYALWSHSTKVLHATTTGEHLPKGV